MKVVFFIASLLCANVLVGQIQINEVNPRNSVLFVSDGSTPDWIEIVNSGQTIIDLSEWYLSDNEDELEKWAFPNQVLAVDSFLLIYASGRDVILSDEIHANFRISGSGEALFLSNQNGLQQTVFQTCAPENYSIIPIFGSQENRWDSVPSPAAQNGPSFEVVRDTLNWSLASGVVSSGSTLTINSINNLDVRFTQERKDVNEADEVFASSNFNWSAESSLSEIPTGDAWKKPEGVPMITTIAARSFFESCPVSRYEIRTFIPQEQALEDVAIVSLTINPSGFFGTEGIYVEGSDGNYWNRGKEWERNANFAYIKGDSVLLQTDVGVRITGSGSRANPQKSLRLYFRDKFSEGIAPNLFFEDRADTFEYKRLVLRATGSDFTGSLIRDDLFSNLLRQSSLDYLSGEPTIVFINGEYWGIHFVKEYTNKYLLARKHGLSPDDINIIENQGNVTEGSDALWQEVKQFMASEDMSTSQSMQWIESRMDLENLCEYLVYQDVAANWDVTQNNVKLWYSNQVDAKIRFIAFDGDATHYRLDFDMIDFLLQDNDANMLSFIFQKLWQNRAFQSKLRATYVRILGELDLDAILNDNEETITFISEHLEQHQLRWHIPENSEKWYRTVEKVQGFLQLRRDIVLTNLSQHTKGILVFPNPASMILQADIPTGTNVYILDLTGREVMRTNYNASISVANLPSGSYLLVYDFNNVRQTTQFQINR